MTPAKNLSAIALCLIILITASTVTLTNATTEGNYKTDNNFLTSTSESVLTENGYKANIIINPYATGIYAQENGYKLDLAISPEGVGGSLNESNYELDVIPEKALPEFPDVAVTEIVASKTVVAQGFSTPISVTVSNQALEYETLCLTVYANATEIERREMTLTGGSSTTIAFAWDTTGFALGNYSMSACATPVPGEADTADNTYVGGAVQIIQATSGVGGYRGPYCN